MVQGGEGKYNTITHNTNRHLSVCLKFVCKWRTEQIDGSTRWEDCETLLLPEKAHLNGFATHMRRRQTECTHERRITHTI